MGFRYHYTIKLRTFQPRLLSFDVLIEATSITRKNAQAASRDRSRSLDSDIAGILSFSVKYLAYAQCEIFPKRECEMKFAHVRAANISHLRSKYFTAQLFHLPEGQISLKNPRLREDFSGWGTRIQNLNPRRKAAYVVRFAQRGFSYRSAIRIGSKPRIPIKTSGGRQAVPRLFWLGY